MGSGNKICDHSNKAVKSKFLTFMQISCLNISGVRPDRVAVGIILAIVTGFLASAAGESALPRENAGQGRFIDAHVHFQDCSVGDLDKVAEWMKSNDVQCVLNYPLAQTRPKNDDERKQMLENYAKYKGRIARACAIFPDEVKSLEETIKLLTREKQDGAVAFGEHYGGFDGPENLRLYEACAKVGLPVMIHLGRKGLPGLENVLKLYPDCIIIAHSSGWWSFLPDGTCDRLLKTYPNLYADISCATKTSQIVKDKKFGKEFLIRHADKLLLGTDSSSCALTNKPAPEILLIHELNLPKEVEDKICRKNAERLFRGVNAVNPTAPGEQIQ